MRKIAIVVLLLFFSQNNVHAYNNDYGFFETYTQRSEVLFYIIVVLFIAYLLSIKAKALKKHENAIENISKYCINMYSMLKTLEDENKQLKEEINQLKGITKNE